MAAHVFTNFGSPSLTVNRKVCQPYMFVTALRMPTSRSQPLSDQYMSAPPVTLMAAPLM